MAWRTLDGGGAVMVDAAGRPVQQGAYWSDSPAQDGGNLALVLAYAQITTLKGQVVAAVADLKAKRDRRTQWYGNYQATDAKENGLKATTANTPLVNPTLTSVSYDQSSLDSLATCLLARDRIEAGKVAPAEEAQDLLLTYLEVFLGILANERLWAFLGGTQNGTLALVLTGGFASPQPTVLGSGA